MLGLVIFGILIAYLGLAAFSVRAALRSAREAGLPARQCWKRAGFVALVFYLIPFWDWIPTLLAHEYYCATEAKFDVFKTVEQWKTENMDALPTLRFDRTALPRSDGVLSRYSLNQRIEIVRSVTEPVFLSVKRESAQVVDIKSGRVLAEYADFRTGYASFGVGGAGAWKFWLKRHSCGDSAKGKGALFAALSSEWIGLGRGKNE